MLRNALFVSALLLPASASATHPPVTIADVVVAESSTNGPDNHRRDYDILLAALTATGLDAAVADPNASLTVFAPNDRAFIRTARDLGYHGFDETDALNFLLDTFATLDPNGDPLVPLTDVLLYHVVDTEIDFFDFIVAAFTGSAVTTLQGEDVYPFFLGLEDGEPSTPDPRLRRPSNIETDNGIIHTINRVLIPSSLLP